jgi:hypothetical protein
MLFPFSSRRFVPRGDMNVSGRKTSERLTGMIGGGRSRLCFHRLRYSLFARSL